MQCFGHKKLHLIKSMLHNAIFWTHYHCRTAVYFRKNVHNSRVFFSPKGVLGGIFVRALQDLMKPLTTYFTLCRREKLSVAYSCWFKEDATVKWPETIRPLGGVFCKEGVRVPAATGKMAALTSLTQVTARNAFTVNLTIVTYEWE